MTALEKLQAESRERQRQRFLAIQRDTFIPPEAKLFIEEVPEPELMEEIIPEKKVRKIRQPKARPPRRSVQKVDLGKIKQFNKKNDSLEPEKLREFIKSKEVNRVYESAFTYKEDAIRPPRPPSKYSNRRAIDEYE